MAEITPRRILIDTVKGVLTNITVANGFRTDAGLYVTDEPGQIPRDRTSALAVVIGKQERPTEPGQRDRARLTTLLLIAKVPAEIGSAQTQLDAIVADIEEAMDQKSLAQYPAAIQWPRYVSMEPITPEPGMGWTGAALTYQTHIPIR